MTNEQRCNPNSYGQSVEELNLADIDVDNIRIKDTPKIERLNDIKINVHVWEGALSLCVRYNNREVIADKTVSFLLVSYPVTLLCYSLFEEIVLQS